MSANSWLDRTVMIYPTSYPVIMPAPIRTFISVDIPMTDEIEQLLEELKGVPNVRPVPEGQIHITLKFLGDTYPDKVEKLCRALRTSLSGTPSFDLSLKGIGAFPSIRDPRVIWVGFEDSSELLSLASIVDETVSMLKLKCDDKRFSPHMTVGRVNGRTDIASLVASDTDKVFCSFRCTHVNIMRSELTPKGARHSVIERIDLC